MNRVKDQQLVILRRLTADVDHTRRKLKWAQGNNKPKLIARMESECVDAETALVNYCAYIGAA